MTQKLHLQLHVHLLQTQTTCQLIILILLHKIFLKWNFAYIHWNLISKFKWIAQVVKIISLLHKYWIAARINIKRLEINHNAHSLKQVDKFLMWQHIKKQWLYSKITNHRQM